MIYALVFGAMINMPAPNLAACLQLRVATVFALQQQSAMGLLHWCPDVMQVVCVRMA